MFAENDIYIKCKNNVQIFYYGKSILEAYIPSLQRGHNIIKAIKKDFSNDIVQYIQESDSEVIFRFHAKYMKELEPYLKPVKNGASISPFSNKNLPKSKYNIPDNDLNKYKSITSKIPKNRFTNIAHITKNYLKSLSNKKISYEDIQNDMAKKGLKGKEYIHSIGKWKEYLQYLEKGLN